jgi:hypothetical protein
VIHQDVGIHSIQLLGLKEEMPELRLWDVKKQQNFDEVLSLMEIVGMLV